MKPGRAALPIAAAVGGMVVPALIFAAFASQVAGEAGAMRGWAIPTATDIAFAWPCLLSFPLICRRRCERFY